MSKYKELILTVLIITYQNIITMESGIYINRTWTHYFYTHPQLDHLKIPDHIHWAIGYVIYAYPKH